MKISVAGLRRKGACKEQVALFKATFGAAPVAITQAACVEHADKFDWDWAARKLLPAPLDAAYEAKRAPLDAAYRAKRAPLLADYRAKYAPLLADYEAKRAVLFGLLAEQVGS